MYAEGSTFDYSRYKVDKCVINFYIRSQRTNHLLVVSTKYGPYSSNLLITHRYLLGALTYRCGRKKDLLD